MIAMNNLKCSMIKIAMNNLKFSTFNILIILIEFTNKIKLLLNKNYKKYNIKNKSKFKQICISNNIKIKI